MLNGGRDDCIIDRVDISIALLSFLIPLLPLLRGLRSEHVIFRLSEASDQSMSCYIISNEILFDYRREGKTREWRPPSP
jgi:hypothetical protein